MPRYRHQPRRNGTVLLAVLIVITLLSLAAYKYNDWMQAEARAADSGLKADQARAFAASGVQYAAAMLAGDISTTLGGNPWDNAEKFQGIEVPTGGGEKVRTGRFSVLSVRAPGEMGGEGAFRYGVTCEAGKINLNAILLFDKYKGDIGKKILMGLPNMTDEIASAILDWIDPDETSREGGAENDFYSGLQPPYRCKNGPLDSLEELLLVKGVTAGLLFGNDRNRNGIIDADEGDGDADLGWQAYLTVYSREVNVGPDQLPRVHLNNPDLIASIEKLKTVMPEELTMYIAAARLYGTSSTSSSGSSSGGSGGSAAGGTTGAGGGTSATGGGAGGSGGGMTSGGTGGMGGSANKAGTGTGGSATGSGSGGTSATTAAPSPTDLAAADAKIQEDLSASAGKQMKNIKSLWDLVNTSVNVTVGTGQQQKTVKYPSPLNTPEKQAELLPTLWQYATTTNDMDLTPRININTAPQAVLQSLQEVGGLTDEEVSSILSMRPQTVSNGEMESFQTPAWLMTEAGLTPAKMKKLDPYITTRSQVYRFQSLGYFDKGGPTARVEAVVDANQGRPRVVYYRDVSELGKGFDVGTPSQ